MDAKHVALHLDDTKAEGVENECVEQLAFADRVLLNKTDLVTPAQLATVRARVATINSAAKVFETSFSVVPLKEVLNIGAFDLARICEMDAAFLDVGAATRCGASFKLQVGFSDAPPPREQMANTSTTKACRASAWSSPAPSTAPPSLAG